MSIEAGQQLLHYRLIEKIGEGGMGVVWMAEDIKLGRRIALKILPEAMAADPERRARFEREARAVAALNHPNIVTLHSVEEAQVGSAQMHFITMELVEGKNLTQLLPKGGFPLDRLLEIAVPLADAVSRAHRAGITHRDLKPDNIMIDGEGRLRVLDFGLAKLQPVGPAEDAQAATITSDTVEGRLLGTVAYMSPEQSEGKPVDARSDIFSLGTVLYEMVCGARPFVGDTRMSTIGAILKDEPSTITELKPSLPRHAGRIIRRCLAKDPDRRYQTALDLRNELEELKTEIDSGLHASVTAAGHPSRNSRLPLFLGATAVIAIAAVVTVALQLRSAGESRSAGFSSRPVTAVIECDDDPCWSPDGKFVAFSRMTGGSHDIYVQPADGGEAVLRAGGVGDQVAARWSPDGNDLVYISSHEPGNAVFLVPAYGGKPRKLIDTDIGSLDVGSMRRSMGDRPWSRDGRTLLVSRTNEGGQIVVHRVDRETRDSQQITFPPAGSDDLGATYSFDGERILFQRHAPGRGTAFIMPAAGGEPEPLVDDEFDSQLFSWRPDNRRVIFRSNRAGSTTDLFEIDVVTRAIRQLTFDTRTINGSSVSADDRVVYTAFWHNTFLFVVDLETGERRQITSHALENFGARFAPDGRTIAYHSTRTGNSEIWLHHLDGRQESRFTDDDAWDVYPEWSPDGQRLVFVSSRDDGIFKVFIGNADGGGGAQLLVDRPISWRRGGYSPVNTFLTSRWSPDGESIAYLVVGETGSELWTVGADGEGAQKRLDEITGFDWYRDSRRAVISRRAGSEEQLIGIDLETGEEQTLLVGALTEIDVAPDGNAVAFSYGRGHMSMGLAVLQLEAPSEPGGLPRATGEPQYVARSEGTWHVHNGSWSPDSKSLVYTQDRDWGDIYELVEKR